MTAISLFALKTRDLSWQDHSMNIEAMLAPTRTYLLMNKHRSLNSKCNKEKEKVEKQRDSSIHSHVSIKRMVDRRNQALYIKRVNMFLGKLDPDMKKTVLERKSFSESLNKIQEENLPEEEEKSPRPCWSKPKLPWSSPRSTSRSRSRTDSIASGGSRKRPSVASGGDTPTPRPSLPVIQTQFREIANPQPYTERRRMLNRKQSISNRNLSLEVPDSFPRVSSATGSRGCRSPVDENLLSVSPCLSPNQSDYPLRNSSPKEMDNDDACFADKKKIVRFDSPTLDQEQHTSKDKPKSAGWQISKHKERINTSSLNYKVQRFNQEQHEFNKLNFIIHTDFHRSASEKDSDGEPSASNLVKLFDEICKSSDKHHVHRLVKLANKIKAKQEPTSAAVPVARTVSASRSFKRSSTAPEFGTRPPTIKING